MVQPCSAESHAALAGQLESVAAAAQPIRRAALKVRTAAAVSVGTAREAALLVRRAEICARARGGERPSIASLAARLESCARASERASRAHRRRARIRCAEPPLDAHASTDVQPA